MKRRAYQKTFTHKWRKEQKKILKKLLGFTCVICDSKKAVCYHEINGKKHSANLNYTVKNYQDFRAICYQCHKIIHYLSKLTNLQKSELLRYSSSLVIALEKSKSKRNK